MVFCQSTKGNSELPEPIISSSDTYEIYSHKAKFKDKNNQTTILKKKNLLVANLAYNHSVKLK